ncbi:hypothetical protein [Neptunicoccus sediminis]|uniref:hypothetical protein n=1 Tax=Neptunicoccus sediminis TaxID=1892596 RepID=UPI000846250F|nr:hypothetical protein [Neptunicoccus sediminis]
MKTLLSAGCLAMMAATSVQAEIVNRRADCDVWEHVPASDALGTPATALLFCNREDEKWLALRIECDVENVRMVMRYRPGFDYTPPNLEEEENTGAQAGDLLTPEEQEAARIVAAIPYDDGGIKTIPSGTDDGPAEMVFMDFRSFGYTGVAHYDPATTDWTIEEKEPLSPVFSRLISGNYADIKLLAYGTTERFPLRGSSKALSPVVEICRIAKRKAERN